MGQAVNSAQGIHGEPDRRNTHLHGYYNRIGKTARKKVITNKRKTLLKREVGWNWDISSNIWVKTWLPEEVMYNWDLVDGRTDPEAWVRLDTLCGYEPFVQRPCHGKEFGHRWEIISNPAMIEPLTELSFLSKMVLSSAFLNLTLMIPTPIWKTEHHLQLLFVQTPLPPPGIICFLLSLPLHRSDTR